VLDLFIAVLFFFSFLASACIVFPSSINEKSRALAVHGEKYVHPDKIARC
jgi:hypothetical protein